MAGTDYEVGQIVLLEGRLVNADSAATVRNEGRDPSGSRLCRLPGHRESVGTPASRGALLCFYERILRARAPFTRMLTREVAAWARTVAAWAPSCAR